MAINYNGDISVVLDMQHRTPGNLRAFVQATLRSITHRQIFGRALQLDGKNRAGADDHDEDGIQL